MGKIAGAGCEGWNIWEIPLLPNETGVKRKLTTVA